MSNNKTVKDSMIKKFGDDCMIESADIRYIPEVIRQSMPGYKEAEDRLEYHHIIPVKENGETTIANGALLKGYNHEWLHKQSPEKQAEINKQLQEYKIVSELKRAEDKVRKCKIALAELRKGDMER